MNIDLEALHRLSFDALPVLLDAAVKGLVLLTVAGVVTAAMRKASAAARQMVWLLALAALIALPAASAALPSWNVLPDWARLKLPGQASESGGQLMNAYPAERHAITATDAHAIDGTEAMLPIAAIDSAGQNEPDNIAAITPIAGPAVTAGAGGGAWPMWVAPLAVTVWLCGTLVCMLPLMLGRISLWRLGRRARRIAVAADSAEQGAGEPWAALLQRAARAIDLRRPIILLQSNDESMPMVWGTLRPKLLLPAQADEWSADRRWVVLLHELAHATRRDCLAKLIAHAACALHWFNPAAWIAFRLMQREAEIACDDMVLDNLAPAVIGDKVFSAANVAAPEPVRPSDYAQHLLEIAGGLKSGMLTSCSSIAMARKSRLEGRLLAILDATRNRRALTRFAVLTAAAFVAAVAIPLACIRAESGDGDKSLRNSATIAKRLSAANWTEVKHEGEHRVYEKTTTLAEVKKILGGDVLDHLEVWPNGQFEGPVALSGSLTSSIWCGLTVSWPPTDQSVTDVVIHLNAPQQNLSPTVKIDMEKGVVEQILKEAGTNEQSAAAISDRNLEYRFYILADGTWLEVEYQSAKGFYVNAMWLGKRGVNYASPVAPRATDIQRWQRERQKVESITPGDYKVAKGSADDQMNDAEAPAEFSEATIVVFDTTTVPAGRWQTLISDGEALRELEKFFPQRGRKSNQAGLWKAGAVVELKRPDGRTVNIQLSGNDGMTTWSEGRGDWPVEGDFEAYIERLRRGGGAGAASDKEAS